LRFSIFFVSKKIGEENPKIEKSKKSGEAAAAVKVRKSDPEASKRRLQWQHSTFYKAFFLEKGMDGTYFFQDVLKRFHFPMVFWCKSGFFLCDCSTFLKTS
jgi:hypothetical protein